MRDRLASLHGHLNDFSQPKKKEKGIIPRDLLGNTHEILPTEQGRRYEASRRHGFSIRYLRPSAARLEQSNGALGMIRCRGYGVGAKGHPRVIPKQY